MSNFVKLQRLVFKFILFKFDRLKLDDARVDNGKLHDVNITFRTIQLHPAQCCHYKSIEISLGENSHSNFYFSVSHRLETEKRMPSRTMTFEYCV